MVKKIITCLKRFISDVDSGFFNGLVGSLHCIGMCGPLALVANKMGGSETAVNSIVYNICRILVYVILGVLFGLIGQVALINGFQKWFSVILGFAIIFLAATLIFKPQINHYLTGQFSFIFKLMGRLNRSSRRGIRSSAILGIINGVLPCGLVYMAVAGAIIQPTLPDSGLFMLSFGLGTLPMMFSITLSGNKLLQIVRGNYRKVLTLGLFCFGLFLVYRGLEMDFTAALEGMFNPEAGVTGCK